MYILSPLFYSIQLQGSTLSNPTELLIIILPKYCKAKSPPESKFVKEWDPSFAIHPT